MGIQIIHADALFICGYYIFVRGMISFFNASAALCHFFRKMGFNIGRPAMDALKADIAPPENRGEYFGYYHTAYRVGDMVFPLIGTYLYATYFSFRFNIAGLSIPGYTMLYVLSSSLGLIGLLSVLVFVNS